MKRIHIVWFPEQNSFSWICGECNQKFQEVKKKNKCWNCGKDIEEPFTICDECARKEYQKKEER
jgi:predicted amidophosphoribosyltransferase